MQRHIIKSVIDLFPGIVDYLSPRAIEIVIKKNRDKRTTPGQYEAELRDKIAELMRRQNQSVLTNHRYIPAINDELRTLVAEYQMRIINEQGEDFMDGGIGVGFDPLSFDQRARDWARNYNYNLINGINETSSAAVGRAISDWIQMPGATNADLNNLIAPIFGDARANAIAITEVTRAYAQADTIYQEYLADMGVTGVVREWMTSEDEKVCPICGALDGKQIEIGEMFVDDDGNEYDNPPAHPNCRCAVQTRINT